MRTGLYQVYWRDLTCEYNQGKWEFEAAFVFQKDASSWINSEINHHGNDDVQYKVMHKGRNLYVMLSGHFQLVTDKTKGG